MIFLIFLKQELKNNLKNLGLFIQNLLFFVISCSVFLIISQNQAQNLTNIIAISLVFSLIFANSNFLQEDFRDGTLEQIMIFLPNLEIYIAAKIIAVWIIYVLPVLLSILPIIWLVGQENSLSTEIFWLFTIFSIAANFICAFCGSLGLAANKSPIFAIFAMPLLVPILLITVSGFSSAENFIFAVKLLTGLAIFCATLFLLATTKIVRIVSD
ncbi:MAG TPA: heme exporter protein CcmB [Rickettsiales bacterium]|nr:heme exporter protein CcmB [Rickettsiales bacterium]